VWDQVYGIAPRTRASRREPGNASTPGFVLLCMAGSPLKRLKKVEAEQARLKKQRQEAKAKRVAGKPKPAPGAKQSSGSNYIATGAPGTPVPGKNGGTLLHGQTNKGGPGRPPKAIREAFAELLAKHGTKRVAEILLARPRKVPVVNPTTGKILRYTYAVTEVTDPDGNKHHVALPAKDDVVLRAAELAARISIGFKNTSEDAPDQVDLPALHVGVDPPLEDDEDAE
jgi:hypothetical protein